MSCRYYALPIIVMGLFATFPTRGLGQQPISLMQVICGRLDSSGNAEVLRLAEADQDIRHQGNSGPGVMRAQDSVRSERVLQLYRADSLRTPEDLVRAALILQHGRTPEHFLLAHELALAAALGGCGGTFAAWLAAAAEDRFLWQIGRPQRFGTQQGKDVTAVDQGPLAVTDELRKAFNVPPIEKADGPQP